jgi:hypothetical protein
MSWKFPSHGKLNAKREGNILYLEGTGPWNLESLLEAGKGVKADLEELYQAPWGVLSVMHGEAAYLPDAQAHLIEVIAEEKTKHRVATALVVIGSSLPTFAKGHLSQIYQKAGEHFAFFDDIDTARQWLIKQITEFKE